MPIKEGGDGCAAAGPEHEEEMTAQRTRRIAEKEINLFMEGIAEVERKWFQGTREQAVPYFNIMRMNPEDIPEAAVLEREIFSDPWSEAMLRSGLDAEAQIYFCVREQKGRLAGYAAMMAVLDEGELLRIGVAPEFRKRGVAAMLIEKIFRTAAERELAFMLLEVRRGNIPAVGLYEKFGFVPEGVRRNYYRNPAEDALMMRKTFAVGEKT